MDIENSIIHSYPSNKSKYIVVRMVIEVASDILEYTMAGEDTGKPLTIKELGKIMEKELEQIKQSKYGIPPKLPDWFNNVDCAEIEESQKMDNS